MFVDFLSESCEEGGISLLGNEDEPIFRGYVLPGQPEFLVTFFELTQTHWIMNASFLLAIFGKCTLGNYCNYYQTSHIPTLLIHINTQTFQYLPVIKM